MHCNLETNMATKTLDELRAKTRELLRELNALSGVAFATAENSADFATAGKAAALADFAADARDTLHDWLTASK